MKKTKVIESLKEKANDRVANYFTNYGRVLGIVEGLERKATYLIRKNKVSFPVQLTHFYKDSVRFKVLSNPNRKKVNVQFHNIAYDRLANTDIFPITTKELMEYFGTATPHMAEVIRSKR